MGSLTVRLPDELLGRLRAESARSGVPQARLVRGLLEELLGECSVPVVDEGLRAVVSSGEPFGVRVESGSVVPVGGVPSVRRGRPSVGPVEEAGPLGRRDREVSEAIVERGVSRESAAPLFGCPVAGCGFRGVRSSRARCPGHGRLVVPVPS